MHCETFEICLWDGTVMIHLSPIGSGLCKPVMLRPADERHALLLPLGAQLGTNVLAGVEKLERRNFDRYLPPDFWLGEKPSGICRICVQHLPASQVRAQETANMVCLNAESRQCLPSGKIS